MVRPTKLNGHPGEVLVLPDPVILGVGISTLGARGRGLKLPTRVKRIKRSKASASRRRTKSKSTKRRRR